MKRNIFAKVTSVILIVIFVGCLLFAMIRTTTRQKDAASFYENRNLAVFPVLEKESVLDGTYFSAIDTYISDHSVARKAVLALKTAIDTYVVKRPVVNDVVVLDDLLLPYNNYEIVDENAINANADIIAQNLKSHKDAAESYGGKFYYIAVPCQYVCYEQSYPWYLNNRGEYTEKSSTALFSRLDENGVSYIDMMDYYEENGKPAEFSSAVDNHFSIFGAFDTYNELLKRIDAETDIKPYVLTKDDFDVTELDNEYLGSRTRKLFGLWESDEKLSIMTPKEEIPIEMWNYGTKQEIPVIYPQMVDEKGRLNYGLYMGGDISETMIKTNREELPNIFIYGDSFSNAVECVAYTGFNTMWSMDYRYYTGDGVDAFIEKYKPDIVVCIRDYEAMLAPWQNGQ